MNEAAFAPDQRLRVFISYSRDDVDIADQIHATLIIGGYLPLIDREGIHAAEEWERRLQHLIEGADTVVFLLSPSSVQSDACAKEIKQALAVGKRIIPVVCRPLGEHTPHDAIRALNYIHLYPEPRKPGTSFGTGLLALRAALDTDLDWLREHTRLLERASEWAGSVPPRAPLRLLSGGDVEAAKAWAARKPKQAPALTPLHLEFIKASEEEEARRQDAEHLRLAQVAEAQAARADALDAQAQAQMREAEALQREAQKARLVVQRTLAGLVVAVALALTASWFGFTARQQRDKAERALAQVRSGASAQVEALVERARQGVSVGAAPRQRKEQTLAEEAAGAAVAASGASTPVRADALILQSEQAFDAQDPLRARELAMQAVASLPANLPKGSTDDLLALFIRAHRCLGLAASRLGNQAAGQAHASLQTALHKAKDWAAAQPKSAAAREHWAKALLDMGDLALASGEASDAAAHLRALLDLRRQDLQEQNTDRARWLLAMAHNRLAGAQTDVGDYAAAERSARQAIALLEDIAAASSLRIERRRELARSFDRMAVAYEARENFELALSWSEKDLALTRELSEAEPDNAERRHDLALALHRRANLLTVVAHHEKDALTSYASAFQAAEASLARPAPRRTEWQRNAAAILDDHGTFLFAKADQKAGLNLLRRSMALRERVAAVATEEQWQCEREAGYRKMRKQLLQMERAAEALEASDQMVYALATAPVLCTQGLDGKPAPQTETREVKIARALATMSWTALIAGQTDRALWAAESATLIDPTANDGWLNLAHAQMFMGQRDIAFELYVKGPKRAAPIRSAEEARAWRDAVRQDFEALKQRSLDEAFVADILGRLGS